MPQTLHSVRVFQRGISSISWAISCRHFPYKHDGLAPGRQLAVAYSSLASPQSFATRARTAAELIAREGLAGVAEGDTRSFYQALKQGISQVSSRERLSKPVDSDLPATGSPIHGKWRNLSLDHNRLLLESDINSSGGRLVRLIEQPGNESDIELWSCLLEFCHRWMGRDGIIMIWQSVFKRRNLYQVDGILPKAFWNTILDAALASGGDFLRDVVFYAEWLLEVHGARWPRLYTTVVKSMLAKSSTAEVLRWHIMLMPSFGPEEAEFVNLLKKFVTDTDNVMQERLQSLYKLSVHRKLYDILIPYLYDKGQPKLALPWRVLFSIYNDTPVTLAARPFLRYLGAYYPYTSLTEKELLVAGLVIQDSRGSQGESASMETAKTGQNLDSLINRVRGETYRIREKPYNDSLGARWFASTWISLDFAINVIHTIGVQEIGPLSVQSIALQEGDAQGLLRRIEQLRQLEIKLPDTNYLTAIQYYATAGDDDALQELLHCDIHPDVFDDDVVQQQLLTDCLSSEDWKTYRSILMAKISVISSAIAASSDGLLRWCAQQRNRSLTLELLQEMSSRNVEPTSLTSHTISSLILHNLSPHSQKQGPRQDVDLLVSLCRQLAATRFPPSVQVWQTLLYRLGREQRLADLERLALDICRFFVQYANSDRPMWLCHIADVPDILRSESPYQHFQKLPRDLPLQHGKHPVRQILDHKLQSSMIRWGFQYTRFDGQAEGTALAVLDGRSFAVAQPVDFHFARGIRLLAILRDQGLMVNSTEISKQAILQIVELYCNNGAAESEMGPASGALKARRRANQLTIAEAKRLCDAAWGSEVMPSMAELLKRIEVATQEDRSKALAYWSGVEQAKAGGIWRRG